MPPPPPPKKRLAARPCDDRPPSVVPALPARFIPHTDPGEPSALAAGSRGFPLPGFWARPGALAERRASSLMAGLALLPPMSDRGRSGRRLVGNARDNFSDDDVVGAARAGNRPAPPLAVLRGRTAAFRGRFPFCGAFFGGIIGRYGLTNRRLFFFTPPNQGFISEIRVECRPSRGAKMLRQLLESAKVRCCDGAVHVVIVVLPF